MFKMFELTPEKMQARMLAEAQRRLVEAEHAENHWRHEANKARAEIERLTGRKVVETTSKVQVHVSGKTERFDLSKIQVETKPLGVREHKATRPIVTNGDPEYIRRHVPQ